MQINLFLYGLIVTLLIFGNYLPAIGAQTPGRDVETCESQPAVGWKRHGNVLASDGICTLHDGQIVTEENLLDFSLFDFSYFYDLTVGQKLLSLN